ncbi:hypothetical protein RDABS01_016155 [Bienertia sinuspersici]
MRHTCSMYRCINCCADNHRGVIIGDQFVIDHEHVSESMKCSLCNIFASLRQLPCL